MPPPFGWYCSLEVISLAFYIIHMGSLLRVDLIYSSRDNKHSEELQLRKCRRGLGRLNMIFEVVGFGHVKVGLTGMREGAS